MAAEETFHINALQMGKLVTNFLSLEFILRAALSKLPGALPPSLPFGHDVYEYPVGTELPVSDVTSDESLSDLIFRYNEANGRYGFSDSIDPSLADLRNTLAHCRLAAKREGSRLRLLMFTRPDKRTKKVRIVYNQEMTDEWFAENNERIRVAISDAVKFDHEVMLRWPPRAGGYPSNVSVQFRQDDAVREA